MTALYVEVEIVEQLETACAAGATRLLVDNQSPETLRAWARRARELSPGIEIEATGGITLDERAGVCRGGGGFRLHRGADAQREGGGYRWRSRL